MAEKRHLITIGGRPGSGKSTVGRLLAKRLGYTFFSTGAYARALAIEHGMTIEAFNEIVAEDGSLDELIDREQKRIEQEEERCVVDAHLGFHFVPSSFKVYLQISLEESARRILGDRNAEIRQKSGDVMDSYEEALARITKRIENHMLRYREHYNVDPYDTSKYDFVIETDTLTPETVVEVIVTAYEDWLRKN